MINSDDSNFETDEIRDAKAIARRALALFGAVGLALGAPQNDVLSWLKEENLWDEMSPSELAYITSSNPTEKQGIDASWKSEALIVLVWALGKVDTLPAPNEQCSTAIFQELLPPYAPISVAEFISSAERRSDQVLMDKANELIDNHWEARDAKFNSKTVPPHLNIEIIQERHHAINWVIGYDGLPWDEVTTDT